MVSREVTPNQALRIEMERKGWSYEELSRRIERAFPGQRLKPNQLTHIFVGRMVEGERQTPQSLLHSPQALYMLLIVLDLELADIGIDERDAQLVADALRGRRSTKTTVAA